MPGCVPGRTPPVRDIRSRTRKQPQVRARGRPGGDHRHRDIGQLSFVDDKLGSAKKTYRQPYPTGSGPRCRSTAGIPDTSFCPGDSPSSTGIHTIRPAERSKPVSASTPSRLRRNWSNRITGKRRRTHLRK